MATPPNRFLRYLSRLRLPKRTTSISGKPEAVPGRPFCLKLRRSPFVALLLIGLLLLGTWGIVYWAARAALTRTANDHLAAVATLKSNEIQQFLHEREIDAQFLVHLPQFAASLQSWLKGNQRDDRHRDALLSHLRSLAASAHYRDISIRSMRDGAILLSSGGDAMDSGTERTQALAAAKESRIEDIHFTYPTVDTLDVGVFSPISFGDEPPVAILHITVDPTESLFPVLQTSPGSSPSAETLLVRRDGSEIVYLNSLRHKPASALRYRLPIAANPQLLASQAVAKGTGLFNGIDYRGVPSLGYALAVDGTPWLLIAKIDADEIYGQHNRLAAFTLITVALSLLLGGRWIADRSRMALMRFREQLERDLLSKRVEFLAKYANDAIMLIDAQQRIVEVNDRALTCYGYTRAEIIGMDIAQIRSPLADNDDLEALDNLMEDQGVILKTEHRTKDGRLFPVEISMRKIEYAGEICVQQIVRDIGARVAAERALQESENRFRQLFNLAPLGTAIVTLAGDIDSANSAFCELTGHTLEALKAMPFDDLTCTEDRPSDCCCATQLINAENPRCAIEKRIRHADGHLLWVHQDAILVRDRDGTPVYMIMQFLDISERKIFIERIERLSGLYAAISRINYAILHSTTAQEVYRAACRACVEFGRLPLAWVGIAEPGLRRLLPVASEGVAAHYLDNIVVATDGDTAEGRGPSGSAYREQRVQHCPDYLADPSTAPWHNVAAKIGVASAVALPIFRGGKPHGVLTVYSRKKSDFDHEAISILSRMAKGISFALDHHDRAAQQKQTQETLANYAREIEDLYQNAPCGYHSIDDDGVIVRINDTELRWLGYTRSEVEGRLRLRDLLTESSRQLFDENFPRLKTTGVIVDAEIDLLRKDGTILPTIANATAVRDADGNFIYSRTTLYDITERRKLEAERAEATARIRTLSQHLVAVQEEERRNLAEALHDQTSPNLAAVDIILGSLCRTLPPTARTLVEGGIEDAQALLKDTALNVREICTNLRPTVLDYSGLLPSLASYAKQFSRRTGVKARVTALVEESRLTPEQESLLFRIVQEALTNCAKHAYAKGVEIVLAQTDNQLVLTVSDDGFGFDPRQVGQAGAAPGLGLITMRERAEFAGGTFDIASRPGQGTVVTVRLDAAAAPAGMKTTLRQGGVEFAKPAATLAAIPGNGADTAVSG